MIKLKPLQTIIRCWARDLPYKVRIHLFGSYLKGIQDPKDIDISLEFLHPFSKDKRTNLWFEYHQIWENQLSKDTDEKIHLCLFEGTDSPQMQQNLKDTSILLYDASADRQADEV